MTGPEREPALATRHMVVSGHPLASHAGLEVLEAGGNAIDAGVATALATCVLQSDRVNLGGVAPQVIWSADRQVVETIDGVGVWPSAITPDLFARRHGGSFPHGVEQCVVPGAPDAYLTALERYGTISFGDAAAAAIRYARDGFPVYPLLAQWLEEEQADYAQWRSNRAVYYPAGRAPRVGEALVQRDLSATLDEMVQAERKGAGRGREAGLAAARAAFYEGDIACTIVDHVAREGGLLSMGDLARFRCRVEEPVRTRFLSGLDLYQCGPWSQGPVLGMALDILGKAGVKDAVHNSPEYVHLTVEALKLAFADRYRYFGDPRTTPIPLRELTSPRYAARRAALIDPAQASSELPPPGELRSANTSYLCVVDRHGNAFSCTPSDGPHTTPVIDGLGIVCSPRGQQSDPVPGRPNSIAPGKRPTLTPSPALVMKGGSPRMVFGTPGGNVQPQAMLQVLLNVYLFGMDVQQAIDAPRFVTIAVPNEGTRSGFFARGNANRTGSVYLEASIGEPVAEALAERGHNVNWWGDHTWVGGGVCAVVVDPKRGLLRGGADPRRATCAIGR